MLGFLGLFFKLNSFQFSFLYSYCNQFSFKSCNLGEPLCFSFLDNSLLFSQHSGILDLLSNSSLLSSYSCGFRFGRNSCILNSNACSFLLSCDLFSFDSDSLFSSKDFSLLSGSFIDNFLLFCKDLLLCHLCFPSCELLSNCFVPNSIILHSDCFSVCFSFSFSRFSGRRLCCSQIPNFRISQGLSCLDHTLSFFLRVLHLRSSFDEWE